MSLDIPHDNLIRVSGEETQASVFFNSLPVIRLGTQSRELFPLRMNQVYNSVSTHQFSLQTGKNAEKI